MKKQTINFSVLLLTISLAACGVQMEKAEVNPTPHDTFKGEGLFSGKSGNMLDAMNSSKKGDIVAMAMPVNVYLWRAALDAISFMPLASASVQDGVIITEWYTNPNKKNERVKVNVYVLGKTFAAQNLKVSMFKQIQRKGIWVDTAADDATASKMEETILTKARALRIKVRAGN